MQLRGLAGLHVDREGVVKLGEFGLVYALLLRPGGDQVGGVEGLFFDMDGIKNFFMQRRHFAQRFQHVIKALLGLEIGPERHRHPAQADVFGRFGSPGFELRLKLVAMRAAVPKELNHLNLSGGRLAGRRLAQQQVVLAFSRRFALGLHTQGQGSQRAGRSGRQCGL